jgi:membrane protein implicated in regulation of membrane protease activity
MTWWLWLLLGLVLSALELAAGGFYLIFLGMAALTIGLLGTIGLAGPAWEQWLAFAVVSVVLLVAFRRRLMAMMRDERR